MYKMLGNPTKLRPAEQEHEERAALKPALPKSVPPIWIWSVIHPPPASTAV